MLSVVKHLLYIAHYKALYAEHSMYALKYNLHKKLDFELFCDLLIVKS